MSTLANLLVKLNTEYLKIDPNNNIRSSTTKEWYLNDWYLQVQKDGWFRRPDCETYLSTTTTSGTALYTLPTDFQKFDSVFCDNVEMIKKDRAWTMKMWASSWTPHRYYRFGSQYGVYPTPTTTNTITMVYYKRLPTMTASVNSTLWEDFDSAICAWAAYKAFNSVEKTQKATVMYADYQNLLNTLLGRYLYDDLNVSFWIERSEGIYRDDVL